MNGPPERRRPADGSRHRLFFALWPDAAFRAGLQAALLPRLVDLPARAQAPADWHVTLCFLGAVDAARLEPLEQAAARLQPRPFTLAFGRLEYWSGARVLGLVGEPPPEPALELVTQLAALARAVGLSPDPKPWRPHVTVLRGLAPQAWQRARERIEAAPPMRLPLTATHFRLAESAPQPAEGTRYRSRVEWPL